jgi:hypothetical protein
MDRGEFEEARPFAIDAASSYSGWGLACAAECLAGLEEWDLSHDYAKAEALRYRSWEIQWFRWCVRFDRGDFKEAEATFRKFLESGIKPHYDLQSFHAYATGDVATARKTLKAAFDAGSHARCGLEAAMLHDANGDAKIRDELLRAVSLVEDTPARQTQSHYAKLAQWMIDDLAGKHETIDASALGKQVEEAGPDSSPWLARFLGHYLMNRGHAAESRVWLQYAATAPNWKHLANARTAYDLRKMGIEIEPIRYPKKP